MLADSSPYKSSPKSTQSQQSPIRRSSLNIDVSRANGTKGLDLHKGPISAPIYNAAIVQKFNQNLLKQLEHLKSNEAKDLHQFGQQLIDDLSTMHKYSELVDGQHIVKDVTSSRSNGTAVEFSAS